MKTLNELLKAKTEIKNTINELVAEQHRKEKELDKTKSLINIYETQGKDMGIAKQLITVNGKTENTIKAVVNKAISLIKDGQLERIIKDNLSISCEYNKGFDSFLVDTHRKGYGDINAVTYATVNFRMTMDDLTDENILAILAYLENIVDKGSKYTGDLEQDTVFKFNTLGSVGGYDTDKVYRVVCINGEWGLDDVSVANTKITPLTDLWVDNNIKDNSTFKIIFDGKEWDARQKIVNNYNFNDDVTDTQKVITSIDYQNGMKVTIMNKKTM